MEVQLQRVYEAKARDTAFAALFASAAPSPEPTSRRTPTSNSGEEVTGYATAAKQQIGTH
jgi:hypothetical protein